MLLSNQVGFGCERHAPVTGMISANVIDGPTEHLTRHTSMETDRENLRQEKPSAAQKGKVSKHPADGLCVWPQSSPSVSILQWMNHCQTLAGF